MSCVVYFVSYLIIIILVYCSITTYQLILCDNNNAWWWLYSNNYGKYLIIFYFTMIHFISHDIHIILCIFRWFHSLLYGTMLHAPSFLHLCIDCICYFNKVKYHKINACCLYNLIYLINVKTCCIIQVYVEMLPIVHVLRCYMSFKSYCTINCCL